MEKTKIGTVSAIMLTLSIVVSYITSSLPRTFINETKSGTFLNIIYITAIVLFITMLFCKLFKQFPGFDILDISEFLGGKILEIIVGSLFIFYFIASSSIMLRNFAEGLIVVYYPLTSYVYIVLMFIIAISITNNLGFNATINTATIVFPIVLISVGFLFIGNFKNFAFRRIFPILGNGFLDTFVLGLKNIGAFGGICYMYFLPPMLKEPEKFKKIMIISVITTGAFILLCVACLLFMFSFYVNADEIMPLFTAARQIEFGSFFQRFESLFLLIWIISFCCYLSITCKFATHIFKKMTNLSDMRPISIIFSLLMFCVALIPKNYAASNFFETHIYRYLRIAIGFMLGIIILLLANVKQKVKNRVNH